MQLNVSYDGLSYSVDLDQFKKDVVSFGKSKEADVVIAKEYLSDVHGCFFKIGGIWYIKDLSVNDEEGNGIVRDDGSKVTEEAIQLTNSYLIFKSPNVPSKVILSFGDGVLYEVDNSISVGPQSPGPNLISNNRNRLLIVLVIIDAFILILIILLILFSG